jgi:hypothetical protein
MTLSRQNARRAHEQNSGKSNDPGGFRTHDLRIKSAVPTIDGSGGQRALETEEAGNNGSTPTHSNAPRRRYPSKSPSTPKPLLLGGGNTTVAGR